MISCGFIQTIMSVVLCFLFKEFPRRREEGRVKIRQWLRWEQNRDFPTTPSFTPVALSLSHNFIFVIHTFFPQIHHLPLDFIFIPQQRCIFHLTCSHPELTEDHVLTSAYVKILEPSREML